MDEVKEVADFAKPTKQRNRKEPSTHQQTKLVETQNRSKIPSPQSGKTAKEMDNISNQQNFNANSYPTFQQGGGDHQQQQLIKNEHKRDGGQEVRQEKVIQSHVQQQPTIKSQRDGNKASRVQEATDLANSAVKKHAAYYDGMLRYMRSTRPIRKTASTFNRLRGSGETADETLSRVEDFIHAIDYAISLLVWRIFFFAKDMSTDIFERAGTKGTGLAKLLSSSSSITMALLLPVALVFFSPILLASLFFIVPALIFSIACVIIPACFVIPTVLSVLFIFDLLMPNKYSAKGKSFASRINIFNRAAKPSGNKEANSDDIRATIAYQQTKVH